MKKVLHIFFLCLMSLVALVANAQITSVSELNNTTTYTLKTTERGYFLYNEATSTEALTSSYNLDGGQNATPTGEASQQFAFLHGTYTPEGKYYLYSVGAGKFVGFNTADVKTYLKDAPTTADRVTLTASGSNFILADATNRKVNISTWEAYLGVKVVSCDPDGGNLLVVTAVNTSADFTEALSVIDALEAPKPQYTVTFTFKQNGEVLGSQAVTLNEGSAFPSYSVPSYVEATVEGSLPETVTENTEIVVNTTVKDDCPFKFYQATDAADVVWTALTLKRSPVLYLYATEDGTQISNTAVETLPSDETLKKYAWCFVGDWLNGFTINNLATGKRIASPSTALTDGTNYHAILTDATLEDGTDKFTLVTNAAGNYFIKRADTDNYFLSNFGGTTNTLLSFWNSGNALTDGGTGDGGSIFEVVAITLPEPVLNTLVPTVEPTTATGTLETITLNFEKEVTYDNTKTITLGNRMMGITKDITVAVSAEDAKVVTITLAEPVTEPGFLSLYIPEETFTATEDGTFNPELTSPITVLAPTNTFAFESTTPADNANLLELSTVKVTYADVPTLATEGASVDVINTETSTAVTTATVAYDAEDWNSVVFTLAAAITTPGTYTLTIPDEFIWNSQYNESAEDKGVSQGATYTPATTLTFTVIGPIAPISITPADQSEVESFTSATITFEEDVTYDELIEVTIAQRNGLYYQKATVSVDGATVTVSAPEEITEAGTYAISVPAGAFSTADGRTNEAFTTMFAITEPAGPADTFVYTSVVPADGSEVAELSSITVTYPQWVCDYINETPFNVVDAESNVVTTASLTYNDNWEDVVIVLEEPITAEGTYTITVPAGYIYSNEGYDPSAADKGVSNGAIYNPEFTLTYTVKAASEPINTFDYKSVDPANESVVKELGDITITFPAWVTNEVNDTPINVINSEDGSTVTTATLGFPLGEGYDKVVLRLTAAVKENGTYTITVPEGYIYDYDEAICNPEFTLTYTVDTVNGISTVTIDSLEGKTIYTIDGRKVSGKLQRGAYIIDGQKKFVK